VRAERKVTDDRVQQVIDLKRKARSLSPARFQIADPAFFKPRVGCRVATVERCSHDRALVVQTASCHYIADRDCLLTPSARAGCRCARTARASCW